jgi:hypothetical protein
LKLFLRINWSFFAKVIHPIAFNSIFLFFFIHTLSNLLLYFAQLILTSHEFVCIFIGMIIALGFSLFLS